MGQHRFGGCGMTYILMAVRGIKNTTVGAEFAYFDRRDEE